MEQMRNETEKEPQFQIGDTIFATGNIFVQGKILKRNTQGRIVSRDTIHDWRVVFEGGPSLGVNSVDISHGKVSEKVIIPEEVDRRNDYKSP